jgi:hypothetical protein
VSARIDENGVKTEKLWLKHDSRSLFVEDLKLECHTLKYLILGCECLLQCVYPSLGFFENFLEFSGNYSLFP